MQKNPDVKLKLQSSQRIVDDSNRTVMTEGRMALLDAIAATGSIHQAAKSMGMAYTSAWSKIRSTEAHLKTKIVDSDKARGTRLTPAGHDLLQKYRELKAQCLAADDAVFNTVFNGAGPGPITALPSQKPVPPIVSFVGHSGSGKTTLIEKMIPLLVQSGLKVAIIKHDVHGFEMDKPGKDTWRHKKAGAAATIISSAAQIGMVMDVQHDHQPADLAPWLRFADLIIAEGFKRGSHSKIEVFRPAATGDVAPVCQDDAQLIALVTDTEVRMDLPVFSVDDIASVATFLKSHFNLMAP